MQPEKSIPLLVCIMLAGLAPAKAQTTVLSKQYLISRKYEVYDEGTERWSVEDETEYTYDSTGKLIRELYYGWDYSREPIQWTLIMKNEYTYDTCGNPTQETDYLSLGTTWEARNKYEYAYDSSGALIQVIYSDRYYFVGDEWFLNSKTEYEYLPDTTRRLSNKTFYYWSVSDSLWVVSERHEYVYDAGGRLIQELLPWWNTETNQFDKSRKIDFKYDASGNLITDSVAYWNPDGSEQWLPQTIEENTYDEYWNLETNNRFVWLYSCERCPDYNYGYSYDNNFSFADLVLPVATHYYSFVEYVELNEMFFRHMLEEITMFSNWDNNAGRFTYHTKVTFTYSEENAKGIDYNRDTGIRVYPNPATEYLIFEINLSIKPSIIELFDINGRKVISQTITDFIQVSISHLNSGIYFYQVIGEDRVSRGKIIIRQ